MPPIARRSLLAASLFIAAIAIPTCAVAEPGTMMHTTINTHVQMTDPPMSMNTPAVSVDACGPAHVDVRDVMAHAGDNRTCSFSAYKTTASGASYHYACDSKHGHVEGDATFAVTAGGFHGSSHGTSNMGGHAMVVDATYSGTTTGKSCDYTPPKAP
ncbi:MAG: DUF3617 family protein [Proteobacteria bacterium]|nr:DUF3617 family protein [Pseudomonadota bacterium]